MCSVQLKITNLTVLTLFMKYIHFLFLQSQYQRTSILRHVGGKTKESSNEGEIILQFTINSGQISQSKHNTICTNQSKNKKTDARRWFIFFKTNQKIRSDSFFLFSLYYCSQSKQVLQKCSGQSKHRVCSADVQVQVHFLKRCILTENVPTRVQYNCIPVFLMSWVLLCSNVSFDTDFQSSTLED